MRFYAVSTFHSIDSNQVSVISHCGESRRFSFVFVGVSFQEFLSFLSGCFFTVECSRHYSAFNIFATNIDEFLGFPSIAAHEGNVDAQLVSLFNQECRFSEVTRSKYCIRVFSFQVGQDCGEVFVASLIVSNVDDAIGIVGQFNECFFEEFSQAYRVVVGNFLYDSYFTSAVFECIVSHNSALERVDEASTEVVIVVSGYLRVGAGSADSRNFSFFNDVTSSHSQGRAIGTNQGNNFVFFNQASCYGSRFCFVGFVVSYNQFNFFAQYGRMNFVSQFDAAQFQFAASSVIAGQRQEYANFNNIRFRSFFFVAAAAGESAEHYSRSKQYRHDFFQLHKNNPFSFLLLPKRSLIIYSELYHLEKYFTTVFLM